jgi:hypothetical protein
MSNKIKSFRNSGDPVLGLCSQEQGNQLLPKRHPANGQIKALSG